MFTLFGCGVLGVMYWVWCIGSIVGTIMMYSASLKMKILLKGRMYFVWLGCVRVHVELLVGVWLLLRYKFWTCCQRRTSDFDEFLRQEGCTTGEHKWIEVYTVVVFLSHDELQ